MLKFGLNWLIALVMLFLLVVLALPVALVGIPAWYVRIVGVRTTGTVSLIADCYTPQGSKAKTYIFNITFTDSRGQQVRVPSPWSCTSVYSDGEQIQLWYLSDTPSHFLTSDEALWLYFLTSMWSLVTLLVMRIFLYFARPVLPILNRNRAR